MKKQKMSLANIHGKLSRTEMKNIMAGEEVAIIGDGGCSTSCKVPGSTGTFGCYYALGTTNCVCMYSYLTCS